MSRVPAGIDLGSLAFEPLPSDRFVYSSYYIGLALKARNNPIITFYQKNAIQTISDNIIKVIKKAEDMRKALAAVRDFKRDPTRSEMNFKMMEFTNRYVSALEDSLINANDGLISKLPDVTPIIGQLKSIASSTTIDYVGLANIMKKLQSEEMKYAVRLSQDLLDTTSYLRSGDLEGNGDVYGVADNSDGIGSSGVSIGVGTGSSLAGGGVGRPFHTIKITAINPTEAAPGTSVQILGSEFDNTKGNIFFSNYFKNVEISSWEQNKIVITLPDLSPGERSFSVRTTSGGFGVGKLKVLDSGASPPSTPGGVTPADTQLLINMLRSPIGYLFLDRTRISPSGFALGEHLYTLSLAPGEEVTLEQKTWTKRQMSLEEMMEKEEEKSIELSSSFSTELQEGLTHENKIQRESNATSSSTVSASGGLHTDVVNVGIEASNSYQTSDNFAEANNTTRTESLKKTSQRTAKVAAKCRTLHKTTFSIKTDVGFESASKRIVRNPNRGTPIDLAYFKVLQRLNISYERYGVRLCWAPFVKDPAFNVKDRIRKAKDDAMNVIISETILPPEPLPPTIQNRPPFWKPSNWIDIKEGHFDLLNGLNIVVDASLVIDDGYDWDNIHARARITQFNGGRGHSATIVGAPWRESKTLKAKIRVEIAPCLILTEAAFKTAKVYLEAQLIPVTTDAEREALETYRQNYYNWKKEVSDLRAQAKQRGEKTAADITNLILSQTNPVSELISRIVETYFAVGVRDDFWEIELWHKIFDFSSFGYTLYPGNWSWNPLPFSEYESTNFLNASWARVYLPIRPGYELDALHFIYYGSVENYNPNPDYETEFNKLITELNDYRSRHFGEREVSVIDKKLVDKFDVIAKWVEVLPTDGTHVEAVIASTTATDQITERTMNNELKLQEGLISNRDTDKDIKEKAAKVMKSTTTTVDVHIDGQNTS